MKDLKLCKRLEKSASATEQVLSICHVYCRSLVRRLEKEKKYRVFESRGTNRCGTALEFLHCLEIYFGGSVRFESQRASVSQSVQRLATGWGVRGSNPGGGQGFPDPYRPSLGPTQIPTQWVPDPFPGGKAAGAWRWLPTPSSTEVEGRVELHICSLSGLLWPVLG